METNQIIIQKKIGRFISLTMGPFVSLCMGTQGVLLSGHFSVPAWILSVAVSVTLAVCIGLFVPVKRFSKGISSRIRNRILSVLADNALTNIVYTIIIATAVPSLMVVLARIQMDSAGVPPSVPRPSILAALPHSWISGFILAMLLTLVLEPVFVRIARKKYLDIPA